MENIDLLRSLIIRGLLKAEVSQENCEFKAWLSSGKYMVRSVPNSKEIHIEINNDYAFLNMLVYDICRMATAAFETMENVQTVSILPKSYSWIAIKSYYAAFFSAHSIMRCFGRICSQLEQGHVKILNDYSQALGLTNNMKPEGGFFTGQYNSSNRILSLKKMKRTHEDTWKSFVKCLETLSVSVLHVNGLSAKKQFLSSEIDDLVSRLQDNGKAQKGNFLSQFRNAVNYRQEHCAWHPYGKQSIESKRILSLTKGWRNESMPITGVWKNSKVAYNFFYSCIEIVNFCYKLIAILTKESQKANNLYVRWPIKLLKLTRPIH